MAPTTWILAGAALLGGIGCVHLLQEVADGRARTAELEARLVLVQEHRRELQAQVAAHGAPRASAAPTLAPDSAPATPTSPALGAPDRERTTAARGAAPDGRVEGRPSALGAPFPAGLPVAFVGPESRMPPELQARVREDRERRLAALRDPAERAEMLRRFEQQVALTHPGLAEELGLSAAEYEALRRRMAESQLALMELSLARDPFAPADAAALEQERRRTAEVLRRGQTAFDEFLGESRRAAYREYQARLPGLHQAQQAAELLADAGLPIDAGQRRRLADLFVEEQRLQQDALRGAAPASPDPAAQLAFAERMLEGQAAADRRLRAAAASVLTPEQLERFAIAREVDTARQRAGLRRSMELQPFQGSPSIAVAIGPAAEPVRVITPASAPPR